MHDSTAVFWSFSCFLPWSHIINTVQPGIERVQACTVLADISRSPLCCHMHRLPVRAATCCHSNATRAPIANPSNSAQLGGAPYDSPSYIRVRAVVWACGRGQTHRQTHRHAWPLYISRRLWLTRNVIITIHLVPRPPPDCSASISHLKTEATQNYSDAASMTMTRATLAKITSIDSRLWAY